MLEIRNITKVYRSKTGESVKALDNVSIQFPESGMVFLLGKSGSGKSTLLNVIGGLDSADSGEFVIMGKSSKDFVGSDFDAYRNTFIGFIFQEYNILDDFTVGANIGLALELQGKKATDEAINGILAQVDLLNYARRKPNELSGGQKQRVAIARALVKEPQIIMADEPTGALDSNTGKQIFDTLKELSKSKLVLVVSHDRDFAERYADRIIELSDGRVIEDVTKHEKEPVRISAGIQQIGGSILRIEQGYQLTSADLDMINQYLAANRTDVLLSGDSRVNGEVCTAVGISADGNSKIFEHTDPGRDVRLREYEPRNTRFIRSRLPMKNAVKMGASGLKHKKFRLVMTILLSLISFAMFGLADTMAAYKHIEAATASVLDSHVRNASMTLGVRYTAKYGDEEPWHSYDRQGFNDADIQKLNAETGMNFVPVYTGSLWGGGFSFTQQMEKYEHNTVYSGTLSGLVDLNEEQLRQTGLSLTGRMPQNENEIVISELMFRQFQQYGFRNQSVEPAESIQAGKLTTIDGDRNSILGKHLSFNTNSFDMYGEKVQLHLTIVGVLDTQFDYDRYQAYLPQDDPLQNNEQGGLVDWVLQSELRYELDYGFHTLGFVKKAMIEKIAAGNNMEFKEVGKYMDGWGSRLYLSVQRTNLQTGDVDSNTFGRVARVADVVTADNVVWLDGRTTNTLAPNEILVPMNNKYLFDIQYNSFTYKMTDAQVQQLAAIYGEALWNMTETPDQPVNFFDRLVRARALQYMSDALASVNGLSAYIEQYAQDEGFVGSARDFWYDKWFYQGESSWPYNYYDGDTPVELSNLGDIENEVRLNPAMIAFVESLYGIDLPTDIASDEIYLFTDILREFYTEDLEYGFDFYHLQRNLRELYGVREFQSKELWTNDKLVGLLISEKYNGIDSKTAWDALSADDQKNYMYWFFVERYLSDEGYAQYYSSVYDPEVSFADLQKMYKSAYLHMMGMTEEDFAKAITIALMEENYETQGTFTIPDYAEMKVAGFISTEQWDLFVSDTIYDYYTTWYAEKVEEQGGQTYEEERVEHDSGIWSFVVAPMPSDDATVAKLMTLHYAEEGYELDYQFKLQNAVLATLDEFGEMIEILSQVFVWIGLGFAVFSAFLLMNFISTSISYKKREIGILRAVGARSSDVFKIFFSESFIIAFINFLLAAIASFATITILNNYMHTQGINMTLLNFGIRQIVLMLGVSVLVAAIASFLPVYSIARKKPVDAIKDR